LAVFTGTKTESHPAPPSERISPPVTFRQITAPLVGCSIIPGVPCLHLATEGEGQISHPGTFSSPAKKHEPSPPAPACSVAACPDGWVGYQGKCYYFSEVEADWTSSQSNCSAHGASLAGIDSLQEMVRPHSGLRRVGAAKMTLPWVGPRADVAPGSWLAMNKIGDAYLCRNILKENLLPVLLKTVD
uniref:C-type lectin domain-containing protein n=1 Tax=Pelusios castaneus TaxID=367368 RepID=A0A8C8RW67_9SAUR